MLFAKKITESPLGPKDWTLQKGQDLIVGAISVGDLGKVQGGAAWAACCEPERRAKDFRWMGCLGPKIQGNEVKHGKSRHNMTHLSLLMWSTSPWTPLAGTLWKSNMVCWKIIHLYMRSSHSSLRLGDFQLHIWLLGGMSSPPSNFITWFGLKICNTKQT